MTLARKNSHLAQAIDVDYSAVGDSLTIPSSGNVTITNSLAISSQTVSTIVGFDENQKLISLPTSTYPSFTELSYLKGVTSSLQTQLNSKSPSASPSFTGSSTFTNSGDVVPLTVTNTGTAASFVVNDVSGDSTPFVVDASGNVGIGISPVFRLHIDGGSAALINSAADPLFYIGEGFGTAEYGFLKWDRTNNQMLIGTDASASVQIVTGNSPRLTISSAGTTTFTGQIVGQAGADISGTTALGDTINIGTASAGNTIVNVGIGATGDRFAITDYIGDTTYTDFGLRVGRANGGANGNSIIQHRGTGVLAVTAIDAGSMVFATSNSPRLTISSTGTATFAGQIVGQAGMDVSGAATFANSGNVVPMTVTNTGTANSFVVNDFSGDNTPFVVDASGNVAIKRSTALSTLHVNGSIQLSSADYSDFSDYWANETNGSLLLSRGILGTSGSYATSLYSNGYRNLSTSFTYMNVNGNTSTASGLDLYPTGEIVLRGGTASGTQLPARLTISSTGTATFAGQVLVTAGSGSAGSYKPGIAVSGDDDTGLQQVGGAGTISIVTQGSERVRVDASGNVLIGAQGGGLGVATPLYLQLGNQFASTAGDAAKTKLRFFEDTSGNIYGFGVSSALFETHAPSGAALATYVGNAERFRISSGGTITAAQVYSDTVGATNRDLFIDNTGKLGYVSSIRASKTNINAIDDVSWLRDLTPVSFHYRRKDDDGNYTDDPDGTLDYGLIAEDVEPVAPELCFYDVVDGEPQLRGVHYSKLITPMLRYIQQLEQRIAALEERLSNN